MGHCGGCSIWEGRRTKFLERAGHRRRQMRLEVDIEIDPKEIDSADQGMGRSGLGPCLLGGFLLSLLNFWHYSVHCYIEKILLMLVTFN
jgi:hypothetical protein